MEELRLIWKRKRVVLLITLVSLVIAGTINFRKYNKYHVEAFIKIDEQNKEAYTDKDRFRSIFTKGLDHKHPLKLHTEYQKEENRLRIEINTGDPDQVKKKLKELKGYDIGSALERKVTSTDKIFYTFLFSLCALVMASVFVLVFLKDEG